VEGDLAVLVVDPDLEDQRRGLLKSVAVGSPASAGAATTAAEGKLSARSWR
jgi:hypothetical protein